LPLQSVDLEKIVNNISLVSIHIPKTAGTSFRAILQDQIGKRKVAKLDINNSGTVLLNNKILEKKRIHKRIEAIHGHFTFAEVQEKFAFRDDVQYITWLRNPVARVVSNYRFLNKIIANRLNELPDENLMARMGKTLVEFAAVQENQNVMHKYLKGASLEKFSFVGIQDQFESELTRLEDIMSWPRVSNRKHNVTGKSASSIDPETTAFIKSVNKEDVILFEQVLQLNQISKEDFK